MCVCVHARVRRGVIPSKILRNGGKTLRMNEGSKESHHTRARAPDF